MVNHGCITEHYVMDMKIQDVVKNGEHIMKVYFSYHTALCRSYSSLPSPCFTPLAVWVSGEVSVFTSHHKRDSINISLSLSLSSLTVTLTE